ncbi:hypothetical protein UlMin_014230 [Ulmus minor]
MAMEEQNFALAQNKSSCQEWKSFSAAVTDNDINSSAGFDCNICLESVHDPVVTLCGHLFCWPCIYKWLNFQKASSQDQEHLQQQCPVCKAEVSEASLVPLYGKGQNTKPPKSRVSHLGIVVPKRPLGPSCWVDSPRVASATPSPHMAPHNYHHQSRPSTSQRGGYSASPMTTSMLDPTMGAYGEMVYARVFGNSITNLYTYPNSYNLTSISSTPRLRSHLMQADKSLSRISFFLFCCFILCLLAF